MDNYVTIVVDDGQNAYDALHTLWKLNDTGDITVHGATVVHRDRHGHINVALQCTDAGVRTAIGVGLGALIGALAGPIGSAVAIGAAAGGAAGVMAEGVKWMEREQTRDESRMRMARGQYAVIAEVSEDWATPIDATMQHFGGAVYRRPVAQVRQTSFLGDDYHHYLHPRDYNPKFSESGNK